MCPSDWMEQEESVRERIDETGSKWRKVYFGGGAHFSNWLEQFKEIYGEENIEVERIESIDGPACFTGSEEPMVRIWTRIPD